MGSLILGGDNLSSKAQTIERLTNPQALISLSECKAGMLKVRYHEAGNDAKQRSNHDKPKNV